MLSLMNSRILLRWSVWGEWSASSTEMLADSISSFRPYFPNANFVVSYLQTAKVNEANKIPDYAQWHSLPGNTGIDPSDNLWLKWFPQDNLDHADIFIAIDADVFCVGHPIDLIDWIQKEQAKSICCMQEANPEPWCYGHYGPLFRELPSVNAGFVVSRSPGELSHGMMNKYDSYRKKMGSKERKWHDEQGALAEYWLEKNVANQASYLSESTNRLLCPSANSEVNSIEGLEIIHTPYPEHPKYYELREKIKASISSATTANLRSNYST